MAETQTNTETENVLEVDVREFRIGNLGTQNDVKTVTDFFKLTGVPDHSVSLFVENEANFAIVRVPPSMVDDITAAHGSELAGRPITVTPLTQPNDVEMVDANQPEDESSLTDTFFVRFSQIVKPFGLPNYAEIANSALDCFQDPSLKVTMRRLGAEKIYRIQLTTKTQKKDRFLSLRCNGEEVRIPLLTDSPFEAKRSREEGILLTFAGAYGDDAELASIPNSAFDKAVAAFNLQMIVPTKLQRVPGSVALNGNRYCILKKVNDVNCIPEYLPVTNPITHKLFNVRSTFRDQARSCARCMKKHVGQCPELKQFFEALNQRKKLKEDKEIKTKIMSDSTMRLADPLGLTAEVSTMSGGGLGQVAQAARDDPENAEMSDIVIIGGANDIKCMSFESNEEFAQSVDLTVDKVIGIATENPSKNYTIVNSHPDISNPPDPVNNSIRTLYLHRKFKQAVTDTIPNFKVLDIHYGTDATNHPSDEGTKSILFTLHDNVGNNSLIWEENYIVSRRPYQRVEELFRYGCNHCNRYGVDAQHDHGNPLLCDTCHVANKDEAKNNRYPLLDEILAEMNETIIDDNRSISSNDDESRNNKRQKLEDGGLSATAPSQ